MHALFFQFEIIQAALKIMELVEKFIKLVAGLINHVREDMQLKLQEISGHKTTQAPVVTTYISHSEFVGKFCDKHRKFSGWSLVFVRVGAYFYSVYYSQRTE